MRIEVPFLHQRFDFSCGVATLLMAMKYFDPNVDLSEANEIDIWREANMVEIYGTSRYGLALSAARRGFSVRIQANVEGIEYVNKLNPPVKGVNEKLLKRLFEDTRRKCLRYGVVENHGRVTPQAISGELNEGKIPVVLVNARMLVKEDIPHWIVVTGIENETLFVNNPLARRPHTPVMKNRFLRYLGYRGDECMLSIGKTF